MALEPSIMHSQVEMENSIYTSLDNTKWKRSIRLLSIDTKSEDIMNCELRVIRDLEFCPPYIAVSYCWGPETPVKTILLNGVKVDIRMNLYELLQQLVRDMKGHGTQYKCTHIIPKDIPDYLYQDRQKTQQAVQESSSWKHFWIDALCIDQANLEEKSHQVAFMSQIYSSAIFVYTWLGPKADDSAIAMQLIDNPKSSYKEWAERATGSAFKQFFQRPFWTRLWVVQEFVLASEVYLRCGDAGALTTELGLFWKDSVDDLLKEEHRIYDSLLLMCTNRWNYQLEEQPPLTDLIITFADRHCSDVKDKAFALMSLTGWREYPAPDYTSSSEHIYREILRTDLNSSGYHESEHYGDGTFDSWLKMCLRVAEIMQIDGETASAYAKLIYDAKKRH